VEEHPHPGAEVGRSSSELRKPAGSLFHVVYHHPS